MSELDIEAVLHAHEPEDGNISGRYCLCSEVRLDEPWTAHVDAVLREQIAAWLESEDLTHDLARLVQDEDGKHYAAGSLHGLGGHDAVPFILAALAAQVAPARVPSEES